MPQYIYHVPNNKNKKAYFIKKRNALNYYKKLLNENISCNKPELKECDQSMVEYILDY